MLRKLSEPEKQLVRLDEVFENQYPDEALILVAKSHEFAYREVVGLVIFVVVLVVRPRGLFGR